MEEMMKDIVELFDKLGFITKIEGNVAKFYDKETGKQMEDYSTGEFEISLDNIEIGVYKTLFLREERKTLRFQLSNPIIDRKLDEKKLIIDSLLFDTGKGSYSIRFNDERTKSLEISSKSGNILITDDNYITFRVNQKRGVYDNGYEQEWELTQDEMIEILNSNEYIQLFIDYYGEIYPGLTETLQNAKNGVKTI